MPRSPASNRNTGALTERQDHPSSGAPRSLWRQLRVVLRLWRYRPERPLSRAQAEEAIAAFRPRAAFVPAEDRALWLLEESREAIALSTLRLRDGSALAAVRGIFELGYFHVRLHLLVNAVDAWQRAAAGAVERERADAEVARTSVRDVSPRPVGHP